METTGYPAGDVVLAVDGIDDHDSIGKCGERLCVFRERDDRLELGLGNVMEEPPKAVLDGTGGTFLVEHVRHDQLYQERFQRQSGLVAPALRHPDEGPKILVRRLPVSHELDLTRRACFEPGPVFAVELPSVARLRCILDNRHNIDVDAGSDERDGRRLSLKLEVFNLLGRIYFDQQVVDRIVETLQRFIIDTAARNVENDVNINRVMEVRRRIVCLANEPALTTLAILISVLSRMLRLSSTMSLST